MSRVFTFWGLKNKIPIFCAHLIDLVELILTIYMKVPKSSGRKQNKIESRFFVLI